MKNLISKTVIILALTSPAISVLAATTGFSTTNNETVIKHSNHTSLAADENSIFTINYVNMATFADTLTTDAQCKGLDVSGKGKGINEAGIKRTENERKGWDGSIKGNSKGITQSGIKRTEAQRKGWDGTVKGGNIQGKSINGINNGMPNRISMNITVAKQTQGTTFGEKVNAGMINVTLVKDGCVVLFPDNEGYRVNTAKQCITKLTAEEYGKVNAGLHATGGALAQGASLLGGALPGGAIISAAISSVGNLAGAAGGGAAAASYAATGRIAGDGKDNDCDGKADVLASVTPLTGTIGGITGGAVAGKAKTSDKVWEVGDQDCDGTAELADGDYELSFVVIEKAASGLKDTLKTQVKIQFSSISNVLKTKHDTAKNSVGNIR